MRYSYVNDGTTKTITVVLDDGSTHVLDNSHTNFPRVLSALQAGDAQGALDALDIFQATRDGLADNGLTFVSPTEILLNGVALDPALTKVLFDTLQSGDNGSSLVKFAKRLDENPSRKSREQLYGFIKANDLTIDEDGYIIAYKGVTTDENGGYVSCAAGPGNVNGVEFTHAQLPNNVGDIVTLDRRLVDDDSNRGCSVGLHAGTYEYASTFGSGITLTVKIDPADVVSVPHDCSYQKVRVCRYEVLATTEEKFLGAVWDGVNHNYIVSGDYDDVDDEYWENEDWDDED
jgi:hypothetical protein